MKNIHELFKEFIREQQCARKAPETIRGYEHAFHLLCKIIPNLTLDLLCPATIVNFFEILDKRERLVGRGWIKSGIKKSTVATYRGKLNKFFQWLVTNHHIQRNPFGSIEYPSVHYEDRRYLKKAEVDSIITAVLINIDWPDSFTRKRNYCILLVGLYCGLRRNEILGLRCDDLDFQNRLLTVRGITSKSKRDRVVPMNNKLISAIKDYLDSRRLKQHQNPYLFTSTNEDRRFTSHGLKHFVDKLKKVTGIGFHVHLLRHTFAVNLVNNGVDIFKIKELLGHKNIEMTIKYLRWLPAKVMKDDIEKLDVETFV